MYSPGIWPWTLHPPASTSWKLVLQAQTTSLSLNLLLLRYFSLLLFSSFITMWLVVISLYLSYLYLWDISRICGLKISITSIKLSAIIFNYFFHSPCLFSNYSYKTSYYISFCFLCFSMFSMLWSLLASAIY
jgi:hypothetical protein